MFLLASCASRLRFEHGYDSGSIVGRAAYSCYAYLKSEGHETESVSRFSEIISSSGSLSPSCIVAVCSVSRDVCNNAFLFSGMSSEAAEAAGICDEAIRAYDSLGMDYRSASDFIDGFSAEVGRLSNLQK